MSNVGQANPFSDASEYNTLDFIIARATEKMQTVSVVQVKAVNTGAQTVDALVLVNLVSGDGTSIPHGVIAARPYFRLQGGGSAVICDPVVGDIGVMVFASRDTSAVIAAKGAANPGSNRKFAWSDGMYFGGVLNSAPTQYVQFGSGGITILSPTAITLQSPANKVQGPLETTGAATFDSTVNITGELTVNNMIHATGEILSDTEVSAPIISTADLIVTSGGSVSLPAGSIPSSALANSGVTAGSYTNANITVNAEGQVTSAANGSSSGLTIASPGATITVTNPTGPTVDLDLPASGVSAGSYTSANITVDAEGRVTAAANGSGSGGTPEPFNVTPDTHPAIPTGVGLGPNDEHEAGSTIDTAGTRYAGATPWTWLNQGSTVSTIVDGANVLSGSADGTNHAITQPAPVAPWEITCKMLIGGPGGGSGTGPGMIVVNGGANQYVFLNETANGPFACYKFNSPTSFAGVLFNSTSMALGQPSAGQWVYMQIQNDGTNLHFLASATGIPGSYTLLGSDALSSFIGTVTDYGEVFNNNVANGIGAFDYFRRTA